MHWLEDAHRAWENAGRPGPDAPQGVLFMLPRKPEALTAGEEPRRIREQRIARARARRRR